MYAVILILVAILAILFMYYLDNSETVVISNIFNYIKENNGIDKDKLLKSLEDYDRHYADDKFVTMPDWKVNEWGEDYTYIKYISMGHTTGKPVMFLSVYYDKSGNFVKAKLETGMKDTVTEVYVKKTK